MVLPDASGYRAMNVAGGDPEGVLDPGLSGRDPTRRLTARIGVAVADPGAETAAPNPVAMADEPLHASKDPGRNSSMLAKCAGRTDAMRLAC